MLVASGFEFDSVHTYFSVPSFKFVSDTATFTDCDFAGVVFCSGVNVTVGRVLSKLNTLSVLFTVAFSAVSFTNTHK